MIDTLEGGAGLDMPAPEVHAVDMPVPETEALEPMVVTPRRQPQPAPRTAPAGGRRAVHPQAINPAGPPQATPGRRTKRESWSPRSRSRAPGPRKMARRGSRPSGPSAPMVVLPETEVPVPEVIRSQSVLEVERPLANGAPLELRGAAPRAETAIPVDPIGERTGEPILRFRWSASELLSASDTTLTIEVDHRPVRSFRLGDLPDGPVDVPLGDLAGGFHRIAFVGRLAIDGDECLSQHEREAWIIIANDANVRWTRVDFREEHVTMAAVPALFGQYEEPIQIAVRAPLDREAAASIVELDHLVRGFGGAPEHVSADRLEINDEPSVLMETVAAQQDGAGPGWEPWRKSLAASPQAVAAIGLYGRQVRVLARTTVALRSAVRNLADGRVRTLCTRMPCAVGRHAGPRPDQAAPISATVLSLEDLGQPNGWTARGAGRHVLRFTWVAPKWWRMKGWPELRLHARAGMLSAIDTSASAIHVTLNEQPLGTFALKSLPNGTSGRLVVRVPQHFWEANEWVFTVSMRLSERATKTRCGPAPEDGPWVTLEPTSRLVVPRVEEVGGGISRFHHEARGQRPRLLWRPSINRDDLVLLASVTWPLAQLTPNATWRWVERTGDCGSTCIVSEPPPTVDTPLGDQGTYGLPVIDAERLAWVYTERSEDGAAQHLYVRRGNWEHRPQTLPLVPFPGLAETRAVLSEGTWHAFDPPTEAPEVVEVRAEPQAASLPSVENEDQRRLVTVNLLWAALSLLSLLGVGVWLYRLSRSVSTDRLAA